MSIMLFPSYKANAEQYSSPVLLVGGSSSFTVEDAVNYSVYDKYPNENVHVSVVTAQLYYNGKPYRMANVPITFSSDNDKVAVLEPLNRTRPSDANGQAKILLIANNTEGLVNITALSQISRSHTIRDTCTVRVVGWGTVSGLVSDTNRNGVPNANVTLWHWDGEKNTGILRAPDNPQLSNDGSTGPIGTYTFTYVPRGDYNVTAEKDGHMYFAMVHVTQGTYTANVAIPDYVFMAPITPTPTPLPAVSASAAASPAPIPTPGMDIFAAMATLGLALMMACKKR